MRINGVKFDRKPEAKKFCHQCQTGGQMLIKPSKYSSGFFCEGNINLCAGVCHDILNNEHMFQCLWEIWTEIIICLCQDQSGFKADREEIENKLISSSSSSFPQAAIGLFTTITSTLFGSLGSSLFGAYRWLSKDEEKAVIFSEEELELCDIHPVSTPVDIGEIETTKETNSVQHTKEVEEEKDCVLPCNNKHPEFFRRFDMVNDCSDHHFVDGAGKGRQSSQVWHMKDLDRLQERAQFSSFSFSFLFFFFVSWFDKVFVSL